MKAAKQQVTPAGESPAPASPLQSALSTAASPSQAYEIYIDNGLICLKHKIRNIEKKKVTRFSCLWYLFKLPIVKLIAFKIIFHVISIIFNGWNKVMCVYREPIYVD